MKSKGLDAANSKVKELENIAKDNVKEQMKKMDDLEKGLKLS